MQTGDRVEQRLGQCVAPADMGLFVEQNGRAGFAGQRVGQENAGAQNAQRKRGRYAAVTAVRPLAGCGDTAPQPGITPECPRG